MKKIFAIAAACVALVGCAKNELNNSRIDDAPIGFQAVVGLESNRAGLDTFTDADQFVATAFLLNENKTWAANSAEAVQYFVKQVVSWNGSTWTTATPYYWPASGSLTFYAHYPTASIGAPVAATIDANHNYIFADYNVDTHYNADLMVADIVADKQANKVPVTFRHKLTKIGVTAIKADATDVANRTVQLTSVKLTNLNNQGTFTLEPTGTNAWDNRSGSVAYELLATTPTVITAYGTQTPQTVATQQEFFLPQAFATEDAKLIITYQIVTPVAGGAGTATETIVKTLALKDVITDSAFDMNDYYTLNIIAGAAVQIEWEAPSIVGWTSETLNINL